MVAVLTNPGVHQKRLRYCNARDEWGFGKQSTAALNRAALVAAAADAATSGRQLYLGRGAVAINDQVAITSGIDVFGEGESTEIIVVGADKNGFVVNGNNRVSFRGFKVNSDTASTVPYKAGVVAYNANDVIIEHVIMDSISWAGVWAQDASRLRIAHCKFAGVLSLSIGNCGDIVAYRILDSTIEDNDCNGGGWQGILVQKPDALIETGRSKNVRIINNRISNQSAYGICSYEFERGDCRHHIIGNKIHNIGGINPNGAGGNGITVVASGGTLVAENEIWDCCKTTTNGGTLVPAGIGVNLRPTDADELNRGVTVRNNIVYGMPQFDCIRASGSGSGHGLNIHDNILHVDNTTGCGIKMIDCSGFSVHNNTIAVRSATLNTNSGIAIDAVVNACVVGVFKGNTINGNSARGISLYSGSPSLEDIAVTSNAIRLTPAGAMGVFVQNSSGIPVTGNAITAAIPLRYNNATSSPATGNKLKSTGTQSVVIAGTCTGLYIGADNTLQGGIANTGTGASYPITGSVSWTPGNIAANTSVTTTMSVVNCDHGDILQAGFSLDLQGCRISAAPSGANAARVWITNPTGSAVDLASGTVWVRGRKMA